MPIERVTEEMANGMYVIISIETDFFALLCFPNAATVMIANTVAKSEPPTANNTEFKIVFGIDAPTSPILSKLNIPAKLLKVKKLHYEVAKLVAKCKPFILCRLWTISTTRTALVL